MYVVSELVIFSMYIVSELVIFNSFYRSIEMFDYLRYSDNRALPIGHSLRGKPFRRPLPFGQVHLEKPSMGCTLAHILRHNIIIFQSRPHLAWL
jgi:hypothetical protein